jgi:sterol desaturase/sphingolipid hydroxylase (fatty acid hydroxylase superfamily)
LMAHESAIRLFSFLGVLLVAALAEIIFPRRHPTVPKVPRWPVNLVMVVLDLLTARLLLPLMPVGMAEIARFKGWGLLNLVSLPVWIELVLALLALDLVIYLQHRAFHRIPLFWRLHRMHHTDLDLDVTSGVRFHPLEIVLSYIIKIGFVAIIGAAPLAVVTFEVLLNATSLFTHANIHIPVRFDRLLRLILVTPDMHRVHHSVIPAETNSNFGFNVSWWDRLLGTYRDQPMDGHDGMIIGLKEYRDPDKLGLWGLLMVPFRKPYG